MMDIFEKPMPVVDKNGNDLDGTTDALRQRFFSEIVPNCPNLDFLLLTKRPSNINKYIPESWKVAPPKNVMFGTSIVNQGTLYTLGRQLQQVNGRKFFSVEPQLDLIIPSDVQLAGIDWVIQGGESGHGKRPFSLDWVAPLREACERNVVAYFFKQIDKIQPVPDWAMIRQFPSRP
jgi:protein gp37